MDEKITLAALRVRAGYIQKEAAPLLGINRATLLRYERDCSNMPAGLVNKMAALYKCPPELIFIGDSAKFAESLRAAP